MYIYTNLRLYWQNKVAELAFMLKSASVFTVKCKFGSFYYILFGAPFYLDVLYISILKLLLNQYEPLLHISARSFSNCSELQVCGCNFVLSNHQSAETVCIHRAAVCLCIFSIPGAADSTCRTQCQCWSRAWTCDLLCVFLLGRSERWPTEILCSINKHNSTPTPGRKKRRKEHFI